jgi:SAM-dependent methyltransferase
MFEKYTKPLLFENYLKFSLASHLEAIFAGLKKGGRILDIGCGRGQALKDIEAACVHEEYPPVTFCGLGEKKPTDLLDGIAFIEANLESLDVTEHKNKFDVIICLVALTCVKDKISFLAKISQMLTPDGKAFFSIEPYYFGLYGRQIFEESNCCAWDEAHRNIIVRHSENPVVVNTQKFFGAECPKELQSAVWGNNRKEVIRVPRFYDAVIVADMMKSHQLNATIGYGTQWELFEFILRKVKTPQIFGQLHPHFRQPDLSDASKIRLLISPKAYEEYSQDKNWQPSDVYKNLKAGLFQKLGEAVIAGSNIFVHRERELAIRKSKQDLFAPWHMFALAGLIAFIAIVIKIIQSLEPAPLTRPGLR